MFILKISFNCCFYFFEAMDFKVQIITGAIIKEKYCLLNYGKNVKI